MKLFNTFSQKLEGVNIKEKISLYVCGITPYDTTHLGHAFTFIIYDSLVKYLRFLGSNVIYAQNVTDIDDDILIRAKHLGVYWQKLGEEETKKHLKNMDALGAARPDHYPRATENIHEIQIIIKKLIDKELAYISGGNVYFEIKKYKSFGKLSKFGYPAMLEVANERGNFPLDKHKKDPLDFVLWQRRHDGEPFWPSPWGEGRPGWHIECSAMSMRYLGQTLTIHGGGTDLIFPHHEAEIAQSENYSGKKFVKVWMHVGMVYFEGKKMSKSLGNMVFVSDLVKKYDRNTIRICLLMHHYRAPWEYHDLNIEDSQKISILFKQYAKKKQIPKILAIKQVPEFFNYLDNDFQTNKALLLLAKLTKQKKIKGEALNTCLSSIGIKY